MWANAIILAASYYFYGSSAAWYLIPLAATSLVDFFVGIRLSKTHKPNARRAWLVLSLVANLGLLGFFKYTPWLIGEINFVLAGAGVGAALPALNVTLPPGISFYTFQTMSYTIEVYRREMPAARNLINYMAFVTFWPHLVAGPIMRAHNLLRQLEALRPVVSPDEARYALTLIVWGLFKKLALADNFGHIVDAIDARCRPKSALPGAGLLFAYAFAGQIYCDFSAYTDIARGSAKLIGVELVRNFDTPYFSASPANSGGAGTSRCRPGCATISTSRSAAIARARRMEYRNLMITMVLGGLWHGAGCSLSSGARFHGAALVLYRVLPIDRHLTARLGRVGKIIAILITFHLVCFGWILFRANAQTIGPLLRSIPEIALPGDFSVARLYARGVLFLGAIVMITDYFGYRGGMEFPEVVKRWNPYLGAAFAVACYFGITILAKREAAQFIYFQF